MQAEISTEMQDEIRDVLSDYGKIRERLFIRLCNREKGGEWIDGVVHRDFLDFAIVPYIDLSHITGISAAGAIPHGMAIGLGIPEETVMEDALGNSPRIKPLKIRKLSDLMEELMGKVTGADVPQEALDNGLSVITNEGVSYGAAAALYPGVLERMAEEKDADLLLIPSSVHEFLVLADDALFTKEEMEALIRDVNRDEVADSDILSNHLYRFDRKTGEIRRA